LTVCHVYLHVNELESVTRFYRDLIVLDIEAQSDGLLLHDPSGHALLVITQAA
jgi:catechol-2,3-dioxygenase